MEFGQIAFLATGVAILMIGLIAAIGLDRRSDP